MVLYYLCSENKGADQLYGYRKADLRLLFSHMQNVGFLMILFWSKNCFILQHMLLLCVTKCMLSYCGCFCDMNNKSQPLILYFDSMSELM